MAPNIEGNGLTNALKQVYYIHKSIVAELMSKNQILEEECRKLKKDSTNSKNTGACSSCHHLKRRLKYALQRRDSEQTSPHKEKDLKLRAEHSKTKSQKRLSDEISGNSGTLEHDSSMQTNFSKKRKSLPPNDLSDLSVGTENPNTSELLLLEKSTKLDTSGLHNATVLAPETEMINPATQAPELQHGNRTTETCQTAFDTSLVLAGKAERSKMFTVPETLNIEVSVDEDGESTDDELFGDEPNDNGTTFNEENKDPNSSQSEAEKLSLQSKDICLTVGGLTQNKVFGKESSGKMLCKADISDSKSNADHRHKPVLEQNTPFEIKSVTSSKSRLYQTTLSQVIQKQTSLNKPHTEQNQNTKAIVAGKQLAQEVKKCFQESDAETVASVTEFEGKDCTKAGSFKVPFSSAEKYPSTSKTEVHSSKKMGKEKSKDFLQESGKYTDHSGSVSKSSLASRLYPKENTVPSVKQTHHVESTGDNDASEHPMTSQSSMDETIAPNLLGQQQIDTQSMNFASPGSQDANTSALVENEADVKACGMEKSKRTQTLQSPDGPRRISTHDWLGTNRSPWNKKSLKLNKSEDGKRLSPIRMTVREIAESKSRQKKSVASKMPAIGKNGDSYERTFHMLADSDDSDADISDDSDFNVLSYQEFDDETIAPSPQADSVSYQSVPCSSRSYKFGKIKTSFIQDSSSQKAVHPSLPRKEIGNDASHPIDLDNDGGNDDDNVHHSDGEESMTSTVKEGDQTTGNQGSQSDGELPEELHIKQESANTLPDLEGDNLDEPEDSFDRVPRNIEPDIPHIQVVRKKSERDKLEGFSCKQCHEYYMNSGLSEEELKKKMKECSRHKERYKRPDTPEHFWTLGFPDTAEIMDRQRSGRHDGESPVAVEKRPRRKKQLMKKF